MSDICPRNLDDLLESLEGLIEMARDGVEVEDTYLHKIAYLIVISDLINMNYLNVTKEAEADVLRVSASGIGISKDVANLQLLLFLDIKSKIIAKNS